MGCERNSPRGEKKAVPGCIFDVAGVMFSRQTNNFDAFRQKMRYRKVIPSWFQTIKGEPFCAQKPETALCILHYLWIDFTTL
jgi:hypothetical protein